MNKKLKSLLDWVVPSPYFDLYRNVRYGGEVIDPLIARNAALKNRHSDVKRCFVIGNGPSLKTQDLTRLSGEICIAANSFFFHPDHRVVAPRYWCVADSDYQAEKKNSLDWLRELEAHSTGATMLFNPSAAGVLKKYELFKDREIYYISAGLNCNVPEEVILDLSRKINVGLCTVSSFSIPLAIYLGFREIYLIGCDANWHSTGDNANLHFYETNPYFKHWDTNAASRQTMKLSIENELLSIHACFKSHRLIRDKALALGIKIYNATNGGCLDMYPRANYEHLFGHASSEVK